MSTSATPEVHSFKAGADLRTKKYHLLKYGADEKTLVLAAAGQAIFAQHNEPNTGEVLEAVYGGGGKVKLAAAVNPGDKITSDANGLGVVAVAGQSYIGYASQVGAIGDVIGFYVDRGTVPNV